VEATDGDGKLIHKQWDRFRDAVSPNIPSEVGKRTDTPHSKIIF